MASTEIVEKEIEVYPGGEFLKALLRMLQERTPVKIAMSSAVSGDIVFTVSYSDLGINSQMLSHPFCRTNAFANTLGELLVRGNISQFCDKVMGQNNYDSLVREYNHRDFGLRTKGADLLFQFHVSLIYRIVNELLLQEIKDEVSKVVISNANKVKRDEAKPSITTIANDGNNICLLVANHNSVRHCFAYAIKTILDFYGIKNKEVFITKNMFSVEIEITDQKNK